MLNIDEITKASKGEKVNGENIEIEYYSISSNDISRKKNTFFIPLKGQNSDGHIYIEAAVSNGAKGFFINKEYNKKELIIKSALAINKNVVIIEVSDTYNSLVSIGRYNANKYPNTFKIGITGSVGKTSTREMVASVLSQKYSVLKTIKNYNSEIGIPLMLLLNNGQDIAIYEMGMDNINQLSKTTKMINPNIAIITNIGTSHIGILGSRENIMKAKMEITEGLSKDGVLLLNGDNDLLSKVKTSKNYITEWFSLNNNRNFEIIEMTEKNTKFKYYGVEYNINEPGEHQIYNAIVAIEIGRKLNLPEKEIKKGIAGYRNFERRQEQEIIKDNILIIDDSYNASMDSMKSGLKSINLIKNRRKLVVLGDMLELGQYSNDIHKELAKELMQYQFDYLFLYGIEIQATYKELINKNNVFYSNNLSEIEKLILRNMKENDLVYFKASNGMKLYNLIKNIKDEY